MLEARNEGDRLVAVIQDSSREVIHFKQYF